MFAIDKKAYNSKLKDIHPKYKLIFSMLCLSICIISNSFAVSVFIIALMLFITVKKGGVELAFYIRLMLLPLSFLIISIVTLLIQKYDTANELLFYFLISNKIFGISLANFLFSLNLFLKAIASISCLYFISLTIPMTELFYFLRKVKIPMLLIEIAELTYRFIFILTETANKILIAQTARLGYDTKNVSIKSLGLLISMLFQRSYVRLDKIYAAQLSRGYDGEINILDMDYIDKRKYYIYICLNSIFLIIIAVIEKVWIL